MVWVWVLFQCDLLSAFLEALKRVQGPSCKSGRDSGDVLISFDAICVVVFCLFWFRFGVFFAGYVSELPPTSFQLNRFHFWFQVVRCGRRERGEGGCNHLWPFTELLSFLQGTAGIVKTTIRNADPNTSPVQFERKIQVQWVIHTIHYAKDLEHETIQILNPN